MSAPSTTNAEGTEVAAHAPRPTRLGAMCFGIAVVLYVAGSNIGSGWVVILSAAMVSGVALDTIAVWRSRRRMRVDVRVEIGHHGVTTTTPTTLAVALRGPVTGASVQVSTLGGTSRAVSRAGHDDVVLSTRLARGHHPAVTTSVRITGPLGLAHARRSAAAATDIWCRPGPLPAAARLHDLAGRTEESTAAHAVDGLTDLRGVREFTSGDARRTVHWRATARHGQLMVRQFETPRPISVRVGIAGGTWSVPSLDLATQLTASLCDAADRAGHAATVAADGAVHAWGPDTHHLLAALPPAAGLGLRPLGVGDDEAWLWLFPDGDAVRVDGPGGVTRLAGVGEVIRWLDGVA